MPRVRTKTRNKGGFKTYTCNGCGKPIVPGEKFYVWEKRYGGPQRRHVSCGYPKPSMLSGRKTAIIEDAIQDADIDGSTSFDDLRSVLEGIADEAESVGQEYSYGADNMPENLQYGYQAEAMREVGSELEDWAQRLRDVVDNHETDDPSYEEPDEPQRGDFDDDEAGEAAYEDAVADYDRERDDWHSRCDAFEEALQEARSEAEDLFGELPEYQG